MLLFESPTMFELNQEKSVLERLKEDVAHNDRERLQFIEREFKKEWNWFKLVKTV